MHRMAGPHSVDSVLSPPPHTGKEADRTGGESGDMAGCAAANPPVMSHCYHRSRRRSLVSRNKLSGTTRLAR